MRTETHQPTLAALPRLTVIPCLATGCLHVFAGKSEAEAIAKLETHLIDRHGVKPEGAEKQ